MGVMRRLEADNARGALKRLRGTDAAFLSCSSCASRPCLEVCSSREADGRPVPIPDLLAALAK